MSRGSAGDVVISVDAGTQSIKAVALDLSGRVLAEARVSQAIQSPRPGWAEQKPEEWWSGLCTCIRTLLSSAPPASVISLAIAYQRETFVMLDADGNPLRPAILWLDQRALEEVKKLDRLLGGDRFQAITGKQLDTTPSAVKLLWIRDNEPHLLRQAGKVLDVGAYLHSRLTGEIVSPIAGADALALMDLESGTWSSEILDILGLDPQVLPALVQPGTNIGTVTRRASADTGLPHGTPVVAGGGDGQVFALGCRSLDNTVLSANLGTGVTFGMHSPAYVVSPYFRTMAGCVPGKFLCESVLRSGSQTISWFVDSLAQPEGEVGRATGNSAEQILERECARVRPGCDGLITVPYWRGVMMPYRDPEARGVTIGWSDYHTRAHFFRSILEGIAFEMRMLESGLSEALSQRTEMIHAGGGGASSDLWCSIISDVMGRNVVRSFTTENTALGAAMLAAWGSGCFASIEQAATAMSGEDKVFHPDPLTREAYDHIYDSVYRRVYPSVRYLTKALGDYALTRSSTSSRC